MYGKVFQTMYDGTLVAHWEALVTFQQMIVLADDVGVVDMTPHALSGRTGIPLEIIEKGLELLEAPDPYSRSPEQDGRRLERLDDHRPWGWQIVNYMKYRQLASHEEKKKADRERLRAKRNASQANENGDVAECRNVSQEVADVAHTDTDTDTDITTHTSPSGDSEGDKSPTCPHQRIIDLYHKRCPDLPRVRTWEGQRKENLRQRFRTHSNLEWWEWFFTVINTLDFYNGRLEGKTWRANLDWIVKHSNFQKLVDICYERTEEQVA